MALQKMRGFSLLEMAAVLGIGLTATAITFISLQPALKPQKVTNAYNQTMALRQPCEAAVSQRMAYKVQFNAGNSTIAITPITPVPGMLKVTYTLPQDVTFSAPVHENRGFFFADPGCAWARLPPIT